MRLSDFEFHLPPDSLAGKPIELRGQPRDRSRLMVVSASNGMLVHDRFFNLGEYLQAGDVLVVNDSQQIPDVVVAEAADGSEVEVTIYGHNQPNTWHCAIDPGDSVQPGSMLRFGASIHVEVRRRSIYCLWELRCGDDEEFLRYILASGQVRMEPYIDRSTYHRDEKYFQTIFARNPGSTDIPSAALHFTQDVVNSLAERGIDVVPITLHISYSSIANAIPESEYETYVHRMIEFGTHKEWFRISRQTAESVNRGLGSGRRVIAVGTTSTRALESAAQGGCVREIEGWTDLHIGPGYEFQIIDGIVTNLHPPRSGQLILCSQIVGREKLLRLYQMAIEEGYLFHEFGDSMLILP